MNNEFLKDMNSPIQVLSCIIFMVMILLERDLEKL